MTEGSDFTGLRHSAARAGTGVFTLYRAGRRCRLRPLAPFMTEGFRLVRSVLIIAARAGIGSVAASRAGRRRHHRFVQMLELE